MLKVDTETGCKKTIFLLVSSSLPCILISLLTHHLTKHKRTIYNFSGLTHPLSAAATQNLVCVFVERQKRRCLNLSYLTLKCNFRETIHVRAQTTTLDITMNSDFGFHLTTRWLLSTHNSSFRVLLRSFPRVVIKRSSIATLIMLKNRQKKLRTIWASLAQVLSSSVPSGALRERDHRRNNLIKYQTSITHNMRYMLRVENGAIL